MVISGGCRRRSPMLVVNPKPGADGEMVAAFALWPRVIAEDWCGEHQMKTVNQEDQPQ